MGLEEFVKRYEPQGKKSILHQYLEDILQLREMGYSYEQILLFLKEEEGVEVQRGTLASFLNRYGHQKPKKKNPVKKTSQVEPKTSAPSYFEKKKKSEVDLDELK